MKISRLGIKSAAFCTAFLIAVTGLAGCERTHGSHLESSALPSGAGSAKPESGRENDGLSGSGQPFGGEDELEWFPSAGPRFSAPTAVFGLSCSKPCELLEEQVLIEKEGYDYYAVMTYRIRTAGPVELVVPNAAACFSSSPQITLDAEPAAAEETQIPKVLTGGALSSWGGSTQSVFYMPNAITAYRQPSTTYLDLFNRMFPAAADLSKTSGQKCWVYDVTNFEEYNDDKDETNFTVTGQLDQPRFLVTSEMIQLQDYLITDCGYDPTLKNLKLYIKSSHRPYRRMLMIPQRGKKPVVTAFGRQLEAREMTVGQTLQRYSSESKRQEILTAVARYLACGRQEDPLIQLSSLNVNQYDDSSLSMCVVPVERAGEHTVTVEARVHTGYSPSATLLQWVGSPDSLWKSVGTRELCVVFGQKRYAYRPGEVQDIEIPKAG